MLAYPRQDLPAEEGEEIRSQFERRGLKWDACVRLGVIHCIQGEQRRLPVDLRPVLDRPFDIGFIRRAPPRILLYQGLQVGGGKIASQDAVIAGDCVQNLLSGWKRRIRKGEGRDFTCMSPTSTGRRVAGRSSACAIISSTNFSLAAWSSPCVVGLLSPAVPSRNRQGAAKLLFQAAGQLARVIGGDVLGGHRHRMAGEARQPPWHTHPRRGRRTGRHSIQGKLLLRQAGRILFPPVVVAIPSSSFAACRSVTGSEITRRLRCCGFAAWRIFWMYASGTRVSPAIGMVVGPLCVCVVVITRLQ